jgi:DNA-binding response OmpR family regulator
MQISNILIVDKADSHLLLLKWILQNKDYMAYTANNIKEAEAFIRLYQLHLILLNPLLSDDEGIEFLEYCYKQNYIKTIPVIVISKEQKTSVINKALDLGIADYIIRPYNINNLINKIEINLKQNKNRNCI